jgi:alkaline phosphatase D
MNVFRTGLLCLLLSLVPPLATRAAAAGGDIVAGPMVGHTTDKSARVWMQLATACQVTISCLEVESGRQVSGVTIDIEGPSPFICDTPMNNLAPNKNYRLEVKLDGDPVKLPDPPLIIRTAPPSSEIANFSIAFGSGLKPAGKGSAPIFKAVADLQPRAYLFLGNAGYLPDKEADFPKSRRAAFRAICDLHESVRLLPDLQPLLRSTACYAVWDDHDFGPAAADRTWVYAKESQAAFQRYWANPDWGTPDNPGAYCALSISDVDFFLLDPRMYRDPQSDPARKTMLGETQLKWLQRGLLTSRATFKVLACPSPMIADYAKAGTWSDYPDERAAFIQWLYDHKVTGVLFLSGARQLGELTIKTPAPDNPAAYPLVDLTSAPLAAKLASDETLTLKNPDRSGDSVAEENFGTLDFGGNRGKRFVTLRLRNDQGKTKLEQTLFAGQLQGK